MTHNAIFKSESISLSDNFVTFDGNTGKSVTLRELVQDRAEKETQRFYHENTSISNSVRQENWQILSNKFEEVLYEKYNEEFLAPTEFIFNSAVKLLHSINDFLGYEMLMPSFIVPDGEGGIRIEWKINNKHLRLSLSEEKVYMYFENDSEYDVIENFNAEELIEKLRWLNQ